MYFACFLQLQFQLFSSPRSARLPLAHSTTQPPTLTTTKLFLWFSFNRLPIVYPLTISLWKHKNCCSRLHSLSSTTTYFRVTWVLHEKLLFSHPTTSFTFRRRRRSVFSRHSQLAPSSSHKEQKKIEKKFFISCLAWLAVCSSISPPNLSWGLMVEVQNSSTLLTASDDKQCSKEHDDFHLVGTEAHADERKLFLFSFFSVKTQENHSWNPHTNSQKSHKMT